MTLASPLITHGLARPTTGISPRLPIRQATGDEAGEHDSLSTRPRPGLVSAGPGFRPWITVQVHSDWFRRHQRRKAKPPKPDRRKREFPQPGTGKLPALERRAYEDVAELERLSSTWNAEARRLPRGRRWFYGPDNEEGVDKSKNALLINRG